MLKQDRIVIRNAKLNNIFFKNKKNIRHLRLRIIAKQIIDLYLICQIHQFNINKLRFH